MKKHKIVLSLCVCLCVFAGLLKQIPNAFAGDINVHPGDKIQAAIDISSDGDVIIVHPGTYYENINFKGRAIIVRSIDPNDPNIVDETIIDGNQVATVVTFNNGENNSSLLSGMTIYNGKATYGGGILCTSSSSPIITHCHITGNRVSNDGRGGGIACYENSSPVITKCKITKNSASDFELITGNFWGGFPIILGYGKGGGIYCENSSPTIFRCHIEKNYASGFFGSSSSGGGIYCESSSPTIIECNVIENSVWGDDSKGGGICCRASSPKITNCLISKNSTIDIGPNGHSYGGGIYFSDFSAPMISNCTIAENSAFSTGELDSNEDGFSYGGGICCYASSPTITNCDIVRNSASAIGSSYFLDPNSEIINGDGCNGGNGYSYGGGIYCNASSPNINNCIIVKNSAVAVGGLCTLDPNTYGNAYSYGGGIYCDDSSANINNCSIADNSATNGVGFVTGFAYPNAFIFESLPNTYREGYSQGGGIACKNLFSPAITNSILWGDFPEEIYVELSTPIFNYCNIQGGYPGEGIISDNPIFVDPNAGDYHLRGASPCIDAGDPNSPITEDKDGITRPIDGDGDGVSICDIGSYEYLPPCEGDFDCDKEVDGTDLSIFAADFGRTDCADAAPCEGDFDKDGDVDGSDLAIFAADFGRTDCPLCL